MKTDQKVSRGILNLKKLTGWLTFGTLQIIEFGFEFVYCPGIYWQAEDAMSRLPKMEKGTLEIGSDVDEVVLTYCILGNNLTITKWLKKTD